MDPKGGPASDSMPTREPGLLRVVPPDAATVCRGRSRDRLLAEPRPFGETPGDLDLSLNPDPTIRPVVITEIVARCCTEPCLPLEDRLEIVWDLRLGDRIERLLRVVGLTERSESLSVVLACPTPRCRQAFEVAVSYAALFAHARTSDANGEILECPGPSGRSLQIRLPTGRDQQSWRSRSYPVPEDALATLVGSLLVGLEAREVRLPREWIERLATILAEADPLVAFEISTSCPHCGSGVDIPVDLEAAALQRIAAHRRRLLLDVHEFALRYGWTEDAVLRIPPSRRAEYRRLADAEERKRS